jgi:hypothetical protein
LFLNWNKEIIIALILSDHAKLLEIRQALVSRADTCIPLCCIKAETSTEVSALLFEPFS